MIIQKLKFCILRVYFTLGLLLYKTRALRFYKGKGAILCYHRIIEDAIFDNDERGLVYKGISIKASEFKKQIIFLKKNYQIVSLDNFLNHIRSNSKEFKLAISFDDGYRDFYDIAYPLIKHHKIPVTLYSSPSFIQSPKSAWWFDVLKHVFSAKKISFSYKDYKYKAILNSRRDKLKAFYYINSLLINSNLEEIKLIIRKLKMKPVKLLSREFISLSEMKKIAKCKYITLGNHSMTHLAFNLLDLKDIQKDIYSSNLFFKKNFNEVPRHFCYPYGILPKDLKKACEIFRTQNIYSAVSLKPSKINSYTDVYNLPRINITQFNSTEDIKIKIEGFSNLTRFNNV